MHRMRPNSSEAGDNIRVQGDGSLDELAGKLRDLVRSYIGEQKHTPHQHEEKVLEDLVKTVQKDLNVFPTSVATGSEAVTESSCLLKVMAIEGNSFPSTVGNFPGGELRNLQLHFQYKGQRATSSHNVDMCVNPHFGETFVFLLTETLPTSPGEWMKLLGVDNPIQVVVTHSPRVNASGRAGAHIGDGHTRKEFLACAAIDWHHALISEGRPLDIELVSNGPDSDGTLAIIGTLRCTLEVVITSTEGPSSRDGRDLPFAVGDVKRVMELKSAREVQVQREFHQYAKRWWQEYSHKPFLKTRTIKVFAEDELGRHRCVSTFLPLPSWGNVNAGRLVPTPRHAARLVSLIPFERQAVIGGSRLEVWPSLHTFLATGRGDCEGHSLLLAALLSKFYLDVFVCVGDVSDESTDLVPGAEYFSGGTGSGRVRDHVWVATFAGKRGDQKVTFWESLTGQRYELPSAGSGEQPRAKGKSKGIKTRPAGRHHFHSISCMFNATELYANKQEDHRVNRTLFDVTDSTLWKRMDSERIVRVPHERTDLTLLPSPIDVTFGADAIETEVRRLITSHRRENSLMTVWDESLCFVLQSALSSYETERLTGVAFGNKEFEQSIQRAVPEGHCFKGFPVCFSHPFPERIFESLRKGAVSSDVLQTNGDYVRLALRVQCCPYAECSIAVWVILAVCYQPLP